MEYADLKGTWILSESFRKSLPESCRNIAIEVADRRLRFLSGKQVVTAECQIGQRHDDFVIMVSAVHVNDEPGCDGTTPDDVKKRFKRLQIWRPEGEGIKVLAPGPILELVKLEVSDASGKAADLDELWFKGQAQ